MNQNNMTRSPFLTDIIQPSQWRPPVNKKEEEYYLFNAKYPHAGPYATLPASMLAYLYEDWEK